MHNKIKQNKMCNRPSGHLITKRINDLKINDVIIRIIN